MPNTIPAAAEGLPTVTRRNALALTGAGMTAALAGVAKAAAAPADGPTRIERAMQEVEEAMEECFGQSFGACIYPASSPPALASHLFNIERTLEMTLAGRLALKAQERDRVLSPELDKLICDHRKTWKALDTHPAAKVLNPTKKQQREQYRLVGRTCRLLRKLAAFRCQSATDRAVKARYLASHPDVPDLLMERDMIPALIRSFA